MRGRRKNNRNNSRNASGKSPAKLETEQSRYDSDSSKSTANDISWWNHNPELTESAGRLSFNNPLGVSFEFNGQQVNPTPGVATIHFAPLIGKAEIKSDPVNVAANNIYTWVRHMNSGARNYEAPDYMMYLLSMDSLYMYHAMMCRIYGTLNLYSITNRYIPEALLFAQGVSYDEMKSQMSDFLFYINQFALRVGSFAVPDSFDYYKRHRFLVSHIYQDANNDKAQFYVYVPDYFYKYSPKTSTTGTQLVPVAWPQQGSSPSGTFLQRIINMGNELLTAALYDEDFGTMAGDTLKAFGRESLIKLPTLEADYATIPDYNVEVLGQIHNTVFQGQLNSASATISQSNGIITYKPGINTFTNGRANQKNWILNSYDNTPGSDQVMEFTRGMSLTRYTPDGTTKILLDSFGTEVFTYASLIQLQNGEPVTSYVLNSSLAPTVSDALMATTQFDWFPLLYFGTVDEEPTAQGGSFTLTNVVGDLRNWTVISKSVLDKLHTTAVLSAFAVEQIGRSTF